MSSHWVFTRIRSISTTHMYAFIYEDISKAIKQVVLVCASCYQHGLTICNHCHRQKQFKTTFNQSYADSQVNALSMSLVIYGQIKLNYNDDSWVAHYVKPYCWRIYNSTTKVKKLCLVANPHYIIHLWFGIRSINNNYNVRETYESLPCTSITFQLFTFDDLVKFWGYYMLDSLKPFYNEWYILMYVLQQ